MQSSKAKKWFIVIGSNVAMLVCFLLVSYVSTIVFSKQIVRTLVCLLYALLWGINSGMLIYREFTAADPVAFSHSNIAKTINTITAIGVLILCGIFFMVS